METLDKVNNQETQEWIAQQISAYRLSDYRWVRELTQYFGEFFDQEFRNSFTYSRFSQVDLDYIFLTLLIMLNKLVSQAEYYLEEETPSFGRVIWSLQHPAKSKEIIINKEKIEKLFPYVILPFLIIEKNLSLFQRDFFKAMGDLKNLEKINSELENQKIGLKDALKILRGESENKDREIEIRNSMIVKLRKGIDKEGGIDKLKSLIDKCYKAKAKDFEWELVKETLEKLADECRNKSTYKTLIYTRLGQKLGVHHSTAKKYCKLFGIKRYI